jgi:hypothetical protein
MASAYPLQRGEVPSAERYQLSGADASDAQPASARSDCRPSDRPRARTTPSAVRGAKAARSATAPCSGESRLGGVAEASGRAMGALRDMGLGRVINRRVSASMPCGLSVKMRLCRHDPDRAPCGAGVVRLDDGEIVITHDVRDGRGSRLGAGEYRPTKDWLDEARCLVGGLLPPGAVSAEVIDDAGRRGAVTEGGGAYVAILNQPNDGHEPVVCCRDAAGLSRVPCRPIGPAQRSPTRKPLRRLRCARLRRGPPHGWFARWTGQSRARRSAGAVPDHRLPYLRP